MPPNIKIKKVGNSLKNLMKNFHKINGEFVKVGHFDEQGIHPSGFTYSALMAFHHVGGNPFGGAGIPPRPVLELLFFNNQKLPDPLFKSAFEVWRNSKLGESSNKILLDSIGRILRDKERAIFGSGLLAPNAVPPKRINSPLIDTGDLRSKVAYKTSISKQVKEK